MQVDFELDPKIVARTGASMVESSVRAAGEDTSKISVRDSSYGMTGWMLVEPATMLSHGASLTENGTVTVVDAEEGEVKIQIKGTTDLSYSYADGRVSARAAE